MSYRYYSFKWNNSYKSYKICLFIVYKVSYECHSNDCTSKPVYCIEWWGLNQHGRNPIVVMERYSCDNPYHLVDSAQNDVLGGYPDKIQNVRDNNPNPTLLTAVKMAMDGILDSHSIDNLVMDADPPVNQLRLDF